MIAETDFSEGTLKMFNEAKAGDSTMCDFVELLINNDFPKDEIKVFMDKHFKSFQTYIGTLLV